MAWYEPPWPWYVRTGDAWHCCRSAPDLPRKYVGYVVLAHADSVAALSGHEWTAAIIRPGETVPHTTHHRTQEDAMRWVDEQVQS